MFTVMVSCSLCGKSFVFNPSTYDIVGLKAIPKRCPACCDEQQHRPEIVTKRECLWSGIVTLGQESAKMIANGLDEFQASDDDKLCWRQTIKGSMYGVQWSGRIELFSHIAPTDIVPGVAVHLREMQATKRIEMHDIRTGAVGGTQHSQRQRVPIDGLSVVERENPSVVVQKSMAETVDHYLVIEPSLDLPAIGRLLWAYAHSKYTLKGYGRQYAAKIEGVPIRSWVVSGGVRSGRIHSEGMLAVMAPHTSLFVVHSECGEQERVEVL